MNLEDRVRLLEEKMKVVEEFMVNYKHVKEFEAIKDFKIEIKKCMR